MEITMIVSASVSPNSTSWISNNSSSTGGSTNVQRMAGYAMAVALLKFAIGTGPLIDHAQLLRSTAQEGSNAIVRVPAYEGPHRDNLLEDAISQIRKNFDLNTSSLAKILKVSRQTIYNWVNGETPSSEHIAKIESLARAATTIADSGLQLTGVALKRRLFSGKTFHEALMEMDADRAAATFIGILRTEQQQRETLARRHKGKAGKIDIDRDFPVSNG
jgi:transcriptional regulator with XRE-family HTH domain